MNIELQKMCMSMLSRLKRKKGMSEFEVPKEQLAALAGYTRRVEHPMDFRTIEYLLNSNQLQSPDDFIRLLRRIASNCLRFCLEGENLAFRKFARQLLEHIENEIDTKMPFCTRLHGEAGLCLDVLDSLLKRFALQGPGTFWERIEVVLTDHDREEYLRQVRYPVDLGHLTAELLEEDIPAAEFLAQAKQVFDNCITFWEPRGYSGLVAQAKEMGKYLETAALEKLPASWRTRRLPNILSHAVQAQHQSVGQKPILPSSTFVQPARGGSSMGAAPAMRQPPIISDNAMSTVSLKPGTGIKVKLANAAPQARLLHVASSEAAAAKPKLRLPHAPTVAPTRQERSQHTHLKPTTTSSTVQLSSTPVNPAHSSNTSSSITLPKLTLKKPGSSQIKETIVTKPKVILKRPPPPSEEAATAAAASASVSVPAPVPVPAKAISAPAPPLTAPAISNAPFLQLLPNPPEVSTSIPANASPIEQKAIKDIPRVQVIRLKRAPPADPAVPPQLELSALAPDTAAAMPPAPSEVSAASASAATADSTQGSTTSLKPAAPPEVDASTASQPALHLSLTNLEAQDPSLSDFSMPRPAVSESKRQKGLVLTDEHMPDAEGWQAATHTAGDLATEESRRELEEGTPLAKIQKTSILSSRQQMHDTDKEGSNRPSASMSRTTSGTGSVGGFKIKFRTSTSRGGGPTIPKRKGLEQREKKEDSEVQAWRPREEEVAKIDDEAGTERGGREERQKESTKEDKMNRLRKVAAGGIRMEGKKAKGTPPRPEDAPSVKREVKNLKSTLVAPHREATWVRKAHEFLDRLYKHITIISTGGAFTYKRAMARYNFDKPVIDVFPNVKEVYLKRISSPMDLTSVRTRLKKGVYGNPKAFVQDVDLVFQNAIQFNENTIDDYAKEIVLVAQHLQIYIDGLALALLPHKEEYRDERLNLSMQRFHEQGQVWREVAIKQWVRKEPSQYRVYFNETWQLIKHLKETDERIADYLVEPVNRHQNPHYYSVITQPMSLKEVSEEVKSGTCRFGQVLEHLDLIWNNAIQYNTPSATQYKYAMSICKAARQMQALLEKALPGVYFKFWEHAETEGQLMREIRRHRGEEVADGEPADAKDSNQAMAEPSGQGQEAAKGKGLRLGLADLRKATKEKKREADLAKREYEKKRKEREGKLREDILTYVWETVKRKKTHQAQEAIQVEATSDASTSGLQVQLPAGGSKDKENAMVVDEHTEGCDAMDVEDATLPKRAQAPQALALPLPNRPSRPSRKRPLPGRMSSAKFATPATSGEGAEEDAQRHARKNVGVHSTLLSQLASVPFGSARTHIASAPSQSSQPDLAFNSCWEVTESGEREGGLAPRVRIVSKAIKPPRWNKKDWERSMPSFAFPSGQLWHVVIAVDDAIERPTDRLMIEIHRGQRRYLAEAGEPQQTKASQAVLHVPVAGIVVQLTLQSCMADAAAVLDADPLASLLVMFQSSADVLAFIMTFLSPSYYDLRQTDLHHIDPPGHAAAPDMVHSRRFIYEMYRAYRWMQSLDLAILSGQGLAVSKHPIHEERENGKLHVYHVVSYGAAPDLEVAGKRICIDV